LSESKSEEKPSIPGVITTAITVAGFAFLYLSQAQQLPVVERALFGSIILVSILLFLVWIWSRPIHGWYEGLRRNWIARKNFHELTTLFQSFKQFVDPGTSQPHFFLYQLKSRGTDFNSITLPSYAYYPQQVAGNIWYGLKGRKSNFLTLKWLSDSLSTLITYYNDAFLSSPVKEVISIIKKKSEEGLPPDDVPQVPEDVWKGFNNARLRWVRFLQDFEGFCSRVSREVGQYRVKIGPDWHDFDHLNAYQFEPPAELPEF